jgi:hypothetical protein
VDNIHYELSYPGILIFFPAGTLYGRQPGQLITLGFFNGVGVLFFIAPFWNWQSQLFKLLHSCLETRLSEASLKVLGL